MKQRANRNSARHEKADLDPEAPTLRVTEPGVGLSLLRLRCHSRRTHAAVLPSYTQFALSPRPPQDLVANDPAELAEVVSTLTEIQASFNANAGGGRRMSFADLIVLGGTTAIEKAAKDAGTPVSAPFSPGRLDALQEQSNVATFEVLKPAADGFRNYFGEGEQSRPSDALADKADMLGLTVSELTALVGGIRALGANADGAQRGVFAKQPGALTNDFFVNLLDMSTAWKPKTGEKYVLEGRERATGDLKWTETKADLVFGSSAELRAVIEDNASDGGREAFAKTLTPHGRRS